MRTLNGLDVFGAEFQFSKEADEGFLRSVRAVNAVKKIDYAVALKFVNLGEQAINRAIRGYGELQDKSIFIEPMDTKARAAKGHLDWHRAKVNAGISSLFAPYPSADDLKKWVVVAFTEYNAALESSRYADEKVNYWGVVGEQLADVLTAAGAAAQRVSDSFWEKVKLPWWAWLVGAGAVLGVTGYFVIPVIIPIIARRAAVRARFGSAAPRDA